jgi:HKD family nuclease
MSAGRKPSSVTAALAINGDVDHANILIDNLAHAKRFTCAVAFARISGFKQIKKSLEARIAAGMSATFVVGIDFFQTEPDLILALLSLRKLAKNASDVKVYMGSEDADYTLHPKIYVFAGRSATTAIVGSANMTWGGLCENHEFSAIIQGPDVNWESVLTEWIEDRVKEGEIVEADSGAVERYAIKRAIYLAHVKMAERRARRAVNSPPGDLDTLRAILATMRADRSEDGFDVQVPRRAHSLQVGPAILQRIAELGTPSPTRFLAIYEELLNGVWHSGGLPRAKTTIAGNSGVFQDSLRALADTTSDDPEFLYNLLLSFMERVPKAGVNVITEILHTRDATRFPVMNGNSVSGMRMANITDYPPSPTKKTVDGGTYARFCADAEKIRSELGLKNFSELDAVFNYAYWRID